MWIHVVILIPEHCQTSRTTTRARRDGAQRIADSNRETHTPLEAGTPLMLLAAQVTQTLRRTPHSTMKARGTISWTRMIHSAIHLPTRMRLTPKGSIPSVVWSGPRFSGRVLLTQCGWGVDFLMSQNVHVAIFTTLLILCYMLAYAHSCSIVLC